jgi:class 3 adenylate cyclase
VLKIGIHFGPAVAGVIGYHKPQFSLIGDTINTTSRVCSKSEPGMVLISEEVYRHVQDEKGKRFIKKTFEAKGKGTLTGYFVAHKVERSSRLKFAEEESHSDRKTEHPKITDL